MNIKYTYLLLEKDKVRSEFVKQIVEKYPIIDIDTALDAQNPDDLDYVNTFLQNNGITIDTTKHYRKLNPKTLAAKNTLYVVYANLLKKYQNYDYVVVLQDDAYFKSSNFEQQIKSLIDTRYVTHNTSARLGQYMSGCLFGNKLYDAYWKLLKKTGIYRPLDHYLAFNNLMKQFKSKIVEVKNFESNIKLM
jgi:hypothetical protein